MVFTMDRVIDLAQQIVLGVGILVRNRISTMARVRSIKIFDENDLTIF